MKTTQSSRPPLERMMQIHARLKDRHFPNARKVAEQLEVSPKTIQRDIDFMRYRLGLPIEYDPLRFGFYYSEPVTSFPNIEVSEGEITALFVAQKALAQYKGTPFEQPLRTAFRKITDGLTDRVSFSWSDLDNVISFRSAGASPADLELFEGVSKAVLRSVEIAFKYRKLRGRDFELRLVQPYHLASIENQWYLFGHDLERGQLRTFALPRMRDLRLTSQALPSSGRFFDREDIARKFWRSFREEEIQNQIAVRFVCGATRGRANLARIATHSFKTRRLNCS